ncbi:MAG: hypothetical protein ACOYL8_04060 [Patescibacteria group bacterium]
MLNPFKKNKSQEDFVNPEAGLSKVENSPEFQNNIDQERAASPELLHDSEAIDVRLEALNEYFKECEDKGIEMTPEMVRLEVRDKLGIEVEELLGNEITDPEIKQSHKSMVKGIDDLMNQKASVKKTALSVLRDKVFGSKAAKVAFISAMLLLKFNPVAGANTNDKKVVEKDQIKTTIDAKKVVSPDGNDGKTFKTTSEDYKEKTNDKIIITAESNFDSGKSILKDSKNIGLKFDKFLSEITKDNFSNLLSQEWTVKGSSDETKYNKVGGNEKLTQERIDALKTILENTLKNHDFSKQLSQSQIKKILEKEINEVYPVDGLEKGVTYITDLINPATNAKYTDSEVKLIKDKNPQEYKNLLKECRYTNFELIAEDNKMFNTDNYDEMALLVDNSGSMIQTRTNMCQSLDSLPSDKPLRLVYFSDKIDKVVNDAYSPKGASLNILKNTNFGKSSGNEKCLSSAIEYLRNIAPVVDGKKTDKGFSSRIVYIATDEALHDAGAIIQLEEMAKKTHSDIVFLMFYEAGSKFIKVDLETLKLKVIDANGNIAKSADGFKDANGNIINFGG